MKELIDVLDNFYHVFDSVPAAPVKLKSGFIAFENYFYQQFLAYSDKNADITTDFLKTPVNSDQALVDVIEKILEKLKIPKVQWGRYTHCPVSVYDVLVELSERDDLIPEHEKRLIQLIYLIDEEIGVRWDLVLLVGLLGLLGLEISIPLGGASVLQQVVTAALFFPVVSLGYSIGVFLYSLYQSIFDTTTPFFERIRHNFFNMMAASLKIAANSIVIAAAVVASPVVAILAVLASTVTVIKEAVGLAHYSSQNLDDVAKDSLNIHDRARKEVEHAKKINSLAINVVTAILLTAITAVWVFAPAGIMLTVGAVVGMGLVYVAKSIAERINESKMKAKLKDKFSKIEESALVEEQEEALAALEKRNDTLDANHQLAPKLDAEVELGSRIAANEITTPPPTPVEGVPEPSAESSRLLLFSPKGPTFFSQRKVESPDAAAVEQSFESKKTQ